MDIRVLAGFTRAMQDLSCKVHGDEILFLQFSESHTARLHVKIVARFGSGGNITPAVGLETTHKRASGRINKLSAN
jgi:hypothetical protein